MSMHLCGPALTTTGKKKSKVKFRNAAEARKARELEAEWQTLLKRQGVATDSVSRKKTAIVPLKYELGIPSDRSTAHIKSRGQSTGIAALQPVQMYSGNNILGIGQLHKSNAVPVFSSEEAVDISRMRR